MGYNSQHTVMKNYLHVVMVLCSLLTTLTCSAINIIPSTYETINSTQGILVQETTINSDKSVTVVLKNINASNYDNSGEVITYAFEWYLSFKGKRVSDYYTDALRCGKTSSHTVYIWPGEVPNGYEKYITVQLGREQQKIQKNRRDDD